MIKAIIFDLDMCICDTLTVPKSALDPALKILHNSALPQQIKTKIEIALWNTSWDDIIRIYAIPEPIASELGNAYAKLETPDGVKTYGDENFIEKLELYKILVTSGYSRFQETKIKKLGIAHLFDEIIINASELKEKQKGKFTIFKEFLERKNLLPRQVLVVGDNPISELGAAKKLDMISVQTLRPTVKKWDEADYHIASLSELAMIIASC